MTTTQDAKVATVSVREIRHEGANSRVTHRTFFAALVMTDETTRFCGDVNGRKHEGHKTIKTAIACGTAAAKKIGYIGRDGQEH